MASLITPALWFLKGIGLTSSLQEPQIVVNSQSRAAPNPMIRIGAMPMVLKDSTPEISRHPISIFRSGVVPMVLTVHAP